MVPGAQTAFVAVTAVVVLLEALGATIPVAVIERYDDATA
jgi:hypothetical protein